jgi:hypothetical protein
VSISKSNESIIYLHIYLVKCTSDPGNSASSSSAFPEVPIFGTLEADAVATSADPLRSAAEHEQHPPGHSIHMFSSRLGCASARIALPFVYVAITTYRAGFFPQDDVTLNTLRSCVSTDTTST